jgi:hypothetical protein
MSAGLLLYGAAVAHVHGNLPVSIGLLFPDRMVFSVFYSFGAGFVLGPKFEIAPRLA